MNNAENKAMGDQHSQTELTCPVCDAPLKPGKTNQIVDVTCPLCSAEVQTAVFPALFQHQVKSHRSSSLIMADETSCFYHKNKKAILPCSVCGRFMCTLCDMHINGQHLCPACMKSCKQELGNLENHRVLYDKIAFYLAIIPFTLFLWFMTVITAPATIFIVIRYWKAPNSIVSGSRFRYITALVLALIQITGIALLIYWLIKMNPMNP